MNRKIRQIIDIIMTIFFIILMGYYITGNKIHEILGTLIFILFILHHILNIKWYKTIFKRKHTFQIVLNVLLFISMLGMMISGIIISGYVFSFLNVKTTMLGRKLHMISTSWGFILISIHIGMHISSMMNKLKKMIKNTVFEYIYYLIIILLIGLGLYSIGTLRIWEEMFLLVDFKFYDFNQSSILFYLKNTALLNSNALIIYLIFKFKNKKRRKKDE